MNLVLPFVPNARMDRTHSSKEVFTLKYFAEVINSLEFASVTVLDPHSVVSEALIDRVVIKTPAKNIEKVLEKIGVKDSNIAICSDCTCCNQIFGSNRRETSQGNSFTVQAAFIYYKN